MASRILRRVLVAAVIVPERRLERRARHTTVAPMSACLQAFKKQSLSRKRAKIDRALPLNPEEASLQNSVGAEDRTSYLNQALELARSTEV